jgi:hypothetical protein
MTAPAQSQVIRFCMRLCAVPETASDAPDWLLGRVTGFLFHMDREDRARAVVGDLILRPVLLSRMCSHPGCSSIGMPRPERPIREVARGSRLFGHAPLVREADG